MPTAKKSAKTRKRKAAAKKAAVTKKRKVAAKKAVVTKKRKVAAKKAAVTKKRKAAAKKAERPAAHFTSYPASYDWEAVCTDVALVQHAEGGVVFTAKREGVLVIVVDESTMADLAPEVSDSCITVYEFPDAESRQRFLQTGLR